VGAVPTCSSSIRTAITNHHRQGSTRRDQDLVTTATGSEPPVPILVQNVTALDPARHSRVYEDADDCGMVWQCQGNLGVALSAQVVQKLDQILESLFIQTCATVGLPSWSQQFASAFPTQKNVDMFACRVGLQSFRNQRSAGDTRACAKPIQLVPTCVHVCCRAMASRVAASQTAPPMAATRPSAVAYTSSCSRSTSCRSVTEAAALVVVVVMECLT
jgi:hypothetical protein